MIGQMRVLLKVKTLKEEQALRALQSKRREVEEGHGVVNRARGEVAASAATLDAREDAIYAGVLGRVVDRDAIEDTRGAVVDLEKRHGQLTDAVERAVHVLHRLEEEARASAAAHRSATRVKDKYTFLTDDLRDKAEAAATLAEDGEVEEMFGNRRQELR